MAVASIRVSSVQLTASSGATSAFYSGGQQQVATPSERKCVAVVWATREERRRTALIRGLRFYLTKAGKKAYFCYNNKRVSENVKCLPCFAVSSEGSAAALPLCVVADSRSLRLETAWLSTALDSAKACGSLIWLRGSERPFKTLPLLRVRPSDSRQPGSRTCLSGPWLHQHYVTELRPSGFYPHPCYYWLKA